MNIKEKIKLYEKKIEDNKIIGFKKKDNINCSNNIRRKINKWNNIGKNEEIKIEKKEEKKIEKKEEKKIEKKEEKKIEKFEENLENMEDEEELINNMINM